MLHLENSQILADKHGFKYFRSRKSQLIFTIGDLDLGLNCDMNFSIKACLHDARFLAQSLWTRPPMTFGTSCSILRARSCMQDCAYTLQDVKVIKWLVI